MYSLFRLRLWDVHLRVVSVTWVREPSEETYFPLETLAEALENENCLWGQDEDEWHFMQTIPCKNNDDPLCVRFFNWGFRGKIFMRAIR